MGLYTKMVLVMQEVGQLEKDGTISDKTGKKMYNYLSEEQTTAALQRAFVKHKLVMFPVETTEQIFYIEGIQYDKPFKNPVTKVDVKYKIVCAETGESEIISSIGYGSDNNDKGSNKALTGAFKYAQRQSFLISTGDDGDHENLEPQGRKPAASTPVSKQSGRAGSADLINKLSAPKSDGVLLEIKKIWQEVYGSLDKFDGYYQGQQAKKVSDQDILVLIQQKKQEKTG